MENKLVLQYKVPVSSCDNQAKLSIPGIFDLFMDMATEHGDSIRLGMNDLAQKGCIWVAAKTKIRIINRPSMLQQVTATSWPEKPGNIRCNRYYTITDGDAALVEGKTEWTILDLATGRPRKCADIYPQDLEHCTDVVCEEPFQRLSTDFSDAEELAKYTVTSRDIDVSQHVNNVAYIRAILSTFTCKEIEDMNIREMEITYRAQCYEGEELTLCKRKTEDGAEIGVLKADGKTATVLRIVCG